ncbi:MAG: hypothetical protein Q8Q74_23840 [Polaromonas sp.]|nr:hypothetical protein [Polaromonas sp.]
MPVQDHPMQKMVQTCRPAGLRRVGLCLILLLTSLAYPPAFAGGELGQQSGPAPVSGISSDAAIASAPARDLAHRPPRRAYFGQERASPDAVHIADWIVDSADNQGMPFMIVDKAHARVLMFNAAGRLQGAASALLGLARGDDSVPGIGERKLSTILPEERTTPAGRFVSSLARDIHGQEVLWVDYDTAIALHRVGKGTPGEGRAQRLDSLTSDDNRVSYGCINVPVKFYDKLVSPAFTGTNGVVYILPETRSAREVFGSYDVQERALQVAGQQATTTDSSAAIRK